MAHNVIHDIVKLNLTLFLQICGSNTRDTVNKIPHSLPFISTMIYFFVHRMGSEYAQRKKNLCTTTHPAILRNKNQIQISSEFCVSLSISSISFVLFLSFVCAMYLQGCRFSSLWSYVASFSQALTACK